MPVKISVVTAVCNRADTIGHALTSVQSQDWRAIEHIVKDGGSTDGTLDILARHRERIARLVSAPDAGVYHALNEGLSLCSGDVIGFLHADDVYAGSDVLSRIANAFEDPEIDAVYGDLEYVSRNADRVVRRWHAGDFSTRRLAWGWMPPHPTFFARRQLYERAGGFDTKYRIAADYEMILRLLGSGETRLAYVRGVIVRMRLGGLSNRSLGNILRKSAEDYKAIQTHGIGGLGTLCWKNFSKLGQFLNSRSRRTGP